MTEQYKELLAGEPPSILPNFYDGDSAALAFSNGKVFLVYNKPAEEEIEYVSYCSSQQELNFITVHGRTKNLGLKIEGHFGEALEQASIIFLVHTINGKIENIMDIPLIGSL